MKLVIKRFLKKCYATVRSWATLLIPSDAKAADAQAARNPDTVMTAEWRLSS